MNENEFELDGKVYAAVKHRFVPHRCESCAFDDGMACLMSEVPPCSALVRKDNRNVIFMENQQ